MSYAIIRAHVAAVDFDEVWAHVGLLGLVNPAYIELPDGSRVIVVAPNGPHARGHIADHPATTILPHPFRPGAIGDEIAARFPHVDAHGEMSSHDLHAALHAAHGSLLDPEA